MALGAKTLSHASAKELEVLRAALVLAAGDVHEEVMSNEGREIARQLLADVEAAQKIRAKLDRPRS